MTREEIQEQVEELMMQYDNGEIEKAAFVQRMTELIASARNESDV